jgi:2-amino-4-hydroxy-6-hydroxymethyldihydropteridine diphosphokinase
VETALGREKTYRNGPRVIDLDILFYEETVMDSREGTEDPGELWLKIPHASIAEREFVLRPLTEFVLFCTSRIHEQILMRAYAV